MSFASHFRVRLRLALMVVVTAATVASLMLAERELESEAAADREREFDLLRSAEQAAEAQRDGELIARCRELAEKPRIHAALEDNALDLLYPSAESEMAPTFPEVRFYRFLDRNGRVIRPKNARPGLLTPIAEKRLTQQRIAANTITGYLPMPAVREVVTTPIISTETGEPIAALTMGFSPGKQDIWVAGVEGGPWWHDRTGEEIRRQPQGGNFTLPHGGQSFVIFFDPLKANAGYPAAYRVSVFSLEELSVREWRLRWQITLTGAAILAASLLASLFIGTGLAVPVERLAQESERSARFSADASHQLKTPVTVMRAGLEELLRQPQLTPSQCAEVSALIHQTYRLSTLIDDLLLLARLDGGRLRLDLTSIDLSRLIEAALDDAGALSPEEEIVVQAEVPPDLRIAGERRYTAIILQNLIENARKYNRPGGCIRVRAHGENGMVRVDIGNSGTGIPPGAQGAIFERFHRGSRGENVPGYGLGLNLARELARLHGGDLTLVGSCDDWTEFRWTVPTETTVMAAASSKTAVFALILLLGLGGAAAAARADPFDALDRLDELMDFSAPDANYRAQLSGLLDLEGYEFQDPAPGFLRSAEDSLFVPRLRLFLDAQAGSHLYAFAQYRVDTGFDPQSAHLRGRLDEYALRFIAGRHFNLQAGKFATIVGNWTPRHDSWTDPFITPPLPYDNLTGLWDAYPASSTNQLLSWAHVRPFVPFELDRGKLLRLPLIWGPSYATGVSAAGEVGDFTYAIEAKNADLSSRPEYWNVYENQLEDPSFSARLGYRPNEAWAFGLSASEGPYLNQDAAEYVAENNSFSQYREILFAQDAAYAHHHFQLWAEVFETRFEIPAVANADTLAYYVEAKQTFAPAWFAALRWNQQIYGTVPNAGRQVSWGFDVWRADAAIGHRFNAHLQAKLQYSAQQGSASSRNLGHTASVQLTLKL
ncbi:MAG TPA: HAMP domain-containing sensor histidine kinase [Opitutaceae bacterium]